ncbi:MAG: peptidoglycan DD-metalloendopeptidase family protein [Chlorobi bacterium]|nr:peptidoglycan DD-metalloendopeptidase family protein [Chlorobiota bacterium]
MMLNTLIYLLEFSVLTSILYLFYRYLYFKLAYFAWSRYYFYAVLLFSLIIPLLPSFFNYESVGISVSQIFKETHSGKINALIKINQNFLYFGYRFLNIYFIIKTLLIIWLSGVVRYLFILLKNIYSVIKLIKKGQKFQQKNFTIVKSDFNGSVFSFFKFIFINNEFELLNEQEKEQIITHEKIHGNQLHTIDNLIFEVFRSIFWFNPVSRLIAADIKIIHEFIVDNILTGNKNKPDYSKLIVKLSATENNFLTASNFSKEEIKNRIKIISYPENENIRKRRFIISVPVLVLTLFASWFIFSSTNNYLKIPKEPEKIFSKPFDNNTYKIISPYFTHKQFDGITVSHKEVSYEVKSFSNIYAVESGTISHTETKNVFGLKEITVTEELKNGYKIHYSGLYKIFIKPNKKIKKGELIAKSGDIRLYPTINIKISKNDTTYNPEKLY